MNLIDRTKTINALNESQIEYDEYYKGLGKAKEIVDSLPTVDVVNELEKIKAEMDRVPTTYENDFYERPSKHVKFDMLEIIDKHIRTERRKRWVVLYADNQTDYFADFQQW